MGLGGNLIDDSEATLWNSIEMADASLAHLLEHSFRKWKRARKEFATAYFTIAQNVKECLGDDYGKSASDDAGGDAKSKKKDEGGSKVEIE